MKLTKRILFLVIMAIIAFLLIIGANLLVRGKIAANEEKKRENAMEEVYADAYSFGEVSYRPAYLKRYLEENGYPDDQVYIRNVTFARDAGMEVQGIVAEVCSFKKYGGIITMLVGVQNDGTVNGYSILQISDAKGLDMKVKDIAFSDQFKGVKTDRFNLVSYKAELTGDVVAANGAEDASQAVVRGVNAAVLAISFVDEIYGGMLK